MIFTLLGTPIHKIRHRSCVRNNRIHSYDAQDAEKSIVSLKLKSQLNQALSSKDHSIRNEASELTHADIFFIDMEFQFEPPVSCSKTRRNQLLWSEHMSEKPDGDNLEKFYLDCGNKIIWSDDKKVVMAQKRKIWSEHPQTIIKVTGKKLMASNEKIQGILGVFSPTRYHEMLQDIKVLAELEGQMNRSQEHRAADAAYILSKFADAYSDELKKIKKNYPGYWQDCVCNGLFDEKGKRL